MLCSPITQLCAFTVPCFTSMFGTGMSRGLVAHLWSCEYSANTVLYSFFGFPGLCVLGRIKEACA